MGIFDKAKDALGDHPDQVDSGIDKAADFADDRTGGAHADQISSGADLAKDRVADYLGSADEAGRIERSTPSRLTGTPRLTVRDWDHCWEASARDLPRLTRRRGRSRATARVPQSATPRLIEL